ncbi:OLC1v1028500C4 [Oldenlandia corymbosa var. corymbosa]|nr:OLC1v1028500C4 [Oldenlandia corymbosa var. corymbosa]
MDTMPKHFDPKFDGSLRTDGIVSSPLEKRIALDSLSAKSFGLQDTFYNQDQRSALSIDKLVGGAAGSVSRSLPRNLDHDIGRRINFSVEPAAYFLQGEKLNLVGSERENGLFSSSLSELFSRKLRLSSNNPPYGHSVGATAFPYEEEEPFESLEELEAHTIGNLLPDDDDLLSGITDGMDAMGHPSSGDDIEELDVFSNIGGMELGDDGFPSGQSNLDLSGGSGNGQIAGAVGGEHPFGEHPSRTLFVRNINSNVEDSELRILFEQYGDIRTLYTACKHRGFVMISYFDIRAARNAMKALQNKPLRRRKLDIHFSIPKDNPSEKDINQGTLVVFNLDSSVSNDELREIFGVYGEIKEIRETPHRSHYKFIEFYDVRAAEAALRALNRSDIAGKRIKLEPSRPGGARRLSQPFTSDSEQEESGLLLQQASPQNTSTGFSGSFPMGVVTSGVDNGTIFGSHSASGNNVTTFFENAFHHGVSSSVPNSVPSLARVGSSGNHAGVNDSAHAQQGDMKFDFRAVPNFHPHSLPEFHDGLGGTVLSCNSPGHIGTNVSGARASEMIENSPFVRTGSNGHAVELNEVFGSSGNGSCPPPGRHYMWSNAHHPQPAGMMWPNSPSFVNGVCSPHPPQLHAVPRAPSQMLNAILPINNHHVGSAPSVNPSIWDRRHAGFAGESPDASVFHPGSLGNIRISGSSPHPLEFVPRNVFPGSGGSCVDLAVPSKNVGFNPLPQRCMMFPSRGQMMPMMNSFDSPNERTRNRRNDGNSSQGDNKKQFELDIDRIMRGEDKRTTLMIKNIPNKYTSKMLLAAIDERHRGTYDFIYLPIDFKNKCNVGYAFINMTDPSLIIPFFQAFNGKKWEKFNSEKVASLAYARIQGKAALIAHFQNSSLMNEDKRCRPILFHTDGPNAGDQVPFPMGVHVRSRANKNRATSNDENNQESPKHFANGEEFSFNGDSLSSSLKESD